MSCEGEVSRSRDRHSRGKRCYKRQPHLLTNLLTNLQLAPKLDYN